MFASGFTGEKSMREKKQFEANVKIRNEKIPIIFYIIPNLVRNGIFGINVLYTQPRNFSSSKQ